jgi:hypothetical protein
MSSPDPQTPVAKRVSQRDAAGEGIQHDADESLRSDPAVAHQRGDDVGQGLLARATLTMRKVRLDSTNLVAQTGSQFVVSHISPLL